MRVRLTGLMREPGLLGKRLAAGDDTPDGLMAAGGAVRRGGGREETQTGREKTELQQTHNGPDQHTVSSSSTGSVLFCSVSIGD